MIFPAGKISLLHFSTPPPASRTGGKPIFSAAPTWNSFRDAIKEQYYLVESYEDKYIKWTISTTEKGPRRAKVYQSFS